MKILVLGNGFDIDHGLPTSYMDFLNFCNYIVDIENPDTIYFSKLKEQQKKYAEMIKSSNEIKDTFLCLLKGNRLLNYFNNRLAKQGENWIDFEREIKGIIGEFNDIELKLKESNSYSYTTGPEHKVHQILEDLGLSYIDREKWNEISLASTRKDLAYSLNQFSRALEYYVSVFINSTPISGSAPDIVNFAPDKVISFNYSNTYERTYGEIRWREAVEHIHGFALDTLSETSNIILGITTEGLSNKNYYVEFEKYFQRITKKTGGDYRKWLQARKGINEKNEIMFFGHSLDFSDSDIIKDLVFDEKAIIYIYYHSEKAYQQIVANLIEIMGKETLIDFVSGEDPKIQFIFQAKYQESNSAGVEITKDIGKLYQLYNYSLAEIKVILDGIKEKIKSKDLYYFYSQRKTIGLFEALKYRNIEFANLKDFFGICKALDIEKDKNGKVDYIYSEEWDDPVPWGETPCHKETAELVSAINKSNKERYENSQKESFPHNILALTSSEEIKNCLIDIFYQENPTTQYWDELRELLNKVYENKLFEKAFKLIEKEKLPLHVEVKFKHFVSMYDEAVFNIQYNRHLAETYKDEAEGAEDY